jgi:hypothetical protein
MKSTSNSVDIAGKLRQQATVAKAVTKLVTEKDNKLGEVLLSLVKVFGVLQESRNQDVEDNGHSEDEEDDPDVVAKEDIKEQEEQEDNITMKKELVRLGKLIDIMEGKQQNEIAKLVQKVNQLEPLMNSGIQSEKQSEQGSFWNRYFRTRRKLNEALIDATDAGDKDAVERINKMRSTRRDLEESFNYPEIKDFAVYYSQKFNVPYFKHLELPDAKNLIREYLSTRPKKRGRQDDYSSRYSPRLYEQDYNRYYHERAHERYSDRYPYDDDYDESPPRKMMKRRPPSPRYRTHYY